MKIVVDDVLLEPAFPWYPFFHVNSRPLLHRLVITPEPVELDWVFMVEMDVEVFLRYRETVFHYFWYRRVCEGRRYIIWAVWVCEEVVLYDLCRREGVRKARRAGRTE